MWKLISKKTGDEYYLLNEKAHYDVGRSGADINLVGDSSISRTHAKLSPCENHIILEDTSSKYGVFINDNIDKNVRIEIKTKYYLRNGECVLFGIRGNAFLISRVELFTMASGMDELQKAELIDELKPLNVQLANNWQSNINYLTMAKLTLTVKVLHALIENVPIVSKEFWSTYLNNIRSKVKPPNPANFLPPITEDYLIKNSSKLAFNAERRTLFAGKKFVFVNRMQFDTYGPIVKKAGGTVVDIKAKLTSTILDRKDVIVVMYVPSTQSQASSEALDYVQEYLSKSNRRLIPEYEIGMAILNSSIEIHCNPCRKPIMEIIPESEVPASIPNTILVPETVPFVVGGASENSCSNTISESADFAGSKSCENVSLSEIGETMEVRKVAQKRKARTMQDNPAKKPNTIDLDVEDTGPIVPNKRTLKPVTKTTKSNTIDLEASDTETFFPARRTRRQNNVLLENSRAIAEPPKTKRHIESSAGPSKKQKPNEEPSKTKSNIIDLETSDTESVLPARRTRRLNNVLLENGNAAKPSTIPSKKREPKEAEEEPLQTSKPNDVLLESTEASESSAGPSEKLQLQEEQHSRKNVNNNSFTKEVDNSSKQGDSLLAKVPEKLKGSINISDFLDKRSLMEKSLVAGQVSEDLDFGSRMNQSTAIATQPPTEVSQRKRKLKIISDADDGSDEDELFNFDKRGKRTRTTATESSSDPFLELSRISTQQNPCTSAIANSEEPSVKIILPNKPFKPIKTVPKIVEITKDGWLSSSLMKFKEEDMDKTATCEWINSIKSAFFVRTKSMNLSSRSKDLYDSTVVSNAENKNNFKTFVKKQNYQRQKEIVKTNPVQLYNTSSAF